MLRDGVSAFIMPEWVWCKENAGVYVPHRWSIPNFPRSPSLEDSSGQVPYLEMSSESSERPKAPLWNSSWHPLTFVRSYGKELSSEYWILLDSIILPRWIGVHLFSLVVETPILSNRFWKTSGRGKDINWLKLFGIKPVLTQENETVGTDLNHSAKRKDRSKGRQVSTGIAPRNPTPAR